MKFYCQPFNHTIFVASDSEEVIQNPLPGSNFVHLGDYVDETNYYGRWLQGLYIGSMSRGELYRKFSGLDYDKIDFGVPIGEWNADDPAVWYYGENSGTFGEKITDYTIFRRLCLEIIGLMENGEITIVP